MSRPPSGAPGPMAWSSARNSPARLGIDVSGSVTTMASRSRARVPNRRITATGAAKGSTRIGAVAASVVTTGVRAESTAPVISLNCHWSRSADRIVEPLASETTRFTFSSFTTAKMTAASRTAGRAAADAGPPKGTTGAMVPSTPAQARSARFSSAQLNAVLNQLRRPFDRSVAALTTSWDSSAAGTPKTSRMARRKGCEVVNVSRSPAWSAPIS